ncbi:flavin reductase [Paludibacter jiangxiensis]|uniref:NADH-FMN oxidoreductase RutF, flavin reductase (DIM6/NTAB) family n=1 Tax=Paludibacter jiangxiensis TaxID=681398 RepID=A0A171AVG0_9BACT|nr:flavin reductase [Paludibacter jiangxiensis]GAT64331.1 NADH-FMN oxidoreductase RutF, flavin reductase (DIM6/NTAB) family [Paludibacter jiangxiensis]
MINFDALFKISYGLYVVCSGNKEHGNGFICNTVMQVTADPVQLAVCCNKNNYTAEFIAHSGVLSISVLPENVSSELIGTFGYQSGRDKDKLQGFDVSYGIDNVPVLLSETVATIEGKVKQTIDVGTHLIYICEIIEATLLSNSNPITYDYYRKIKKGVSPKNAPTYVDETKQHTDETTSEKYRCLICGYIYDNAENDTPFEQLPEDWECPVCRAAKAMFEKM